MLFFGKYDYKHQVFTVRVEQAIIRISKLLYVFKLIKIGNFLLSKLTKKYCSAILLLHNYIKIDLS